MTRRRLVAVAVGVAIVAAWAMIAWQPSAGVVPGAAPAELPAPAVVKPAAPPSAKLATPAAAVVQPAEPAARDPVQPAAAEPVIAVHPMERENLRPPPAQGPLREYRHQYANESAAADSRSVEASMRGLFDDDAVPADLLDTLVCRRTICKVQVLWTPAYVKSYLGLLQRLRRNYDPEIAAEPKDAIDAEGTRPIELYVKLRAKER